MTSLTSHKLKTKKIQFQLHASQSPLHPHSSVRNYQPQWLVSNVHCPQSIEDGPASTIFKEHKRFKLWSDGGGIAEDVGHAANDARRCLIGMVGWVGSISSLSLRLLLTSRK